MASQPPDSIAYQIFSVPFDTSIQFDGNVETSGDLQGGTVTYTGSAKLGAPFSGPTIKPLVLEVTIGTDGSVATMASYNWDLPLATIIETDVKDKLGQEFWSVVDTVAMPVVSIWQKAGIVIANYEGTSSDYNLPIISGFNAYADTTVSAFEPLTSLSTLFPVLGLDQKQLVIHLGTSPDKTFALSGSLVLDIAMVPDKDWVVFNDLTLDFSQSTTDTTLGVTVTFGINVDGQDLNLKGGLQGSVGASTDLVIWGALESDDGEWKDPFGAKGLTITGMGAQIGVSAAPPYITLGVRGGIDIGGLIDGEVAVLVDTDNPILDISSTSGLDLPRLIKALTSINTGDLLDVSLSDLQIYVAPNGGLIADKDYPPGFNFGGAIDLWGFDANVEGMLDYATGGSLKGSMDPIKLDGLGTSIIQITDAQGTGGASVDIEFSTSRLANTVSGQMKLMDGIVSQSIESDFSTSGFSIKIESNGTIYAAGGVSLDNKDFTLTSSYGIDVSMNVSGIKVGLQVMTSFAVKVNQTSAQQTISFVFDALGVTEDYGPYSYTIPFKEVADLVNAFNQLASDTFNKKFIDLLAQAADPAFDWVDEFYTKSYQEAADLFNAAGADPGTIAQGLVDVYNCTIDQAVDAVSDTSEEAVEILKNTFNYTVNQAGMYLVDEGMSEDAIESTLEAAGYATDAVTNWITDVYDYL